MLTATLLRVEQKSVRRIYILHSTFSLLKLIERVRRLIYCSQPWFEFQGLIGFGGSNDCLVSLIKRVTRLTLLWERMLSYYVAWKPRQWRPIAAEN